jgi:hypothetical protein
MQLRLRRNPGHYDKLDYDNDNDNEKKTIARWTCFTGH